MGSTISWTLLRKGERKNIFNCLLWWNRNNKYIGTIEKRMSNTTESNGSLIIELNHIDWIYPNYGTDLNVVLDVLKMVFNVQSIASSGRTHLYRFGISFDFGCRNRSAKMSFNWHRRWKLIIYCLLTQLFCFYHIDHCICV